MIPTPGAIRWFAAAGLVGGLATSTKYSAAAVLAALGAAQLYSIVEIRSARLVAEDVAARRNIWRDVSARLRRRHALCASGLSDIRGGPPFRRDAPFWRPRARSRPRMAIPPDQLAAVRARRAAVRSWDRRDCAHREALPPTGDRPGSFRCGLLWTDWQRPDGVLSLRPPSGSDSVPFGGSCVAPRRADRGSRRARRLHRRQPPRPLGLLVGGTGLVNSVWFDVLLSRTDSRVLAARWLAPRLRPEDSLYDAGGAYTRLDLSRIDFHRVVVRSKHRIIRASRRADAGLAGAPRVSAADVHPAFRPPLSAWPRPAIIWSELSSATTRRPGSAVYDPQDAFFMPVSGFSTSQTTRTDDTDLPPSRRVACSGRWFTSLTDDQDAER